jgi:hypothetical protein
MKIYIQTKCSYTLFYDIGGIFVKGVQPQVHFCKNWLLVLDPVLETERGEPNPNPLAQSSYVFVLCTAGKMPLIAAKDGRRTPPGIQFCISSVTMCVCMHERERERGEMSRVEETNKKQEQEGDSDSASNKRKTETVNIYANLCIFAFTAYSISSCNIHLFLKSFIHLFIYLYTYAIWIIPSYLLVIQVQIYE